MERFLQKEQVLPGYTSRQSFSSPKVPFRNSSDVDFKDVFGGPPRRSSVQDSRHLGEVSRDSNLSREEEVGESKTHSTRWSGLSDKPVFGEENLNRRRYPSDDFFDDIFRGEESSSSTPRKPSRDPFSSTPGSRIQSPLRTLPYHSDPFGSSSSLPPVLSLPTKLAKDIEYPTFASPSRSPYKNNENAPNGLGFPSSPSVLSSRRSNQDMQGQGGSRHDLPSFYRQSTLSKELLLNSNWLLQVTKSDKHDSENHFKKNSSSSEVSDTNWQFHFSIYKWASTEVPIVMPLREGSSVSLKGRDKPEERTTEFVAPVLEGPDLPSIGDIVLPMNSGNQDENSVPHIKKDRANSSEIVEVVVSAKPESESLFQLNNVLNEVQNNLPSQNLEKEIKRGSSASDTALNRSLSEKTEKKMSVSKKKGQKQEQGPLYFLLKDECDRRGNDKASEQAKEGKERKTPVLKKKTHEQEPNPLYCLLDDSERQGYSKASEQGKPKEGNMKSMHTVAGDVENSKKGKKKAEKKNFLNATEATNSSLQDFFPEEKLVSNKVKGKVKDFVKIFNRESPSKPITTAKVPKKNASVKDNGADRASAVKHSGADREYASKDSGADRPEDQENVPANEADRKGKVDDIQKRISDTSGSVDQILKHSENPHFGVNAASHKISGTSSKRDDNSASCSETRSESVGVRSGNVEESHYPDLNCTVKELSQDQFKQPQNDQSPEDFQAWDAKIRKWSSGKEGNIRSLLSTLQYVLWPESGWKPVPLVDIIEGNPVKRAYQKALLCLHPDKLQQKGATPHQKYIAEKVFDILQDAWTHFNTMGSF